MRHFEKHPDEISKSFSLNGFIFIPNFYDRNEINKIRQSTDRYIREIAPYRPAEEIFYEDDDNPDSLKQIQVMHQHDSFFKELIEGKLLKLAEIVLGEPVEPVNLQYFNKPPGGQATPPHQDGYYFKLKPNHAVTMWLALENVDKENGYVSYIQGSHQYGLRHHGRSGVLGFSQHMLDFGIPHDYENMVSFPAEGGDLLAHHSLTIHKAEANTSKNRTRRVLGFIYYAKNCKEDKAAVKAYKEQLKLDSHQREQATS